MKVKSVGSRLSCSIILSTAMIFAGCGGGGSSNSTFDNMTSNTNGSSNSFAVKDGTYRAAVSNSPYANVLSGCIKDGDTSSPCTLSRLPFIGQNNTIPNKADILAQTLVSHAWMAERFSQLLDQMPADMFLLFRGVTGVVIGADIRPSYYTGNTAAIYLDPADLWITASERATISKEEDYRSGFGNSLKFVNLWRYVKGGDYAWNYYSLNSTVASRSLNDIIGPMASLLFHELAHANDFMPPSEFSRVNGAYTPWQQVQALGIGIGGASTYLTNTYPLNSQIMKDLAQVLYFGVTANEVQKGMSAGDVGAHFAGDGANANYGFGTQYEDAAMLFEETMMKFHYNIDREEAFTDAPTSASPACSEYVVRWGQRNRIGSSVVKTRAQIVVARLLNKGDVSNYFSGLPAPRAMINGLNWCSNLTSMGASPNGVQLQKPEETPIRDSDIRLPKYL